MSVRGLRQRKKKRKNTIVPSNQGRHPLRGFSFVVFTNMRYTETFHRLDVPNYPARCLWIAFRLVIQHALLAKHLVTERYIGTTRKCRQIYRLLPFFFWKTTVRAYCTVLCLSRSVKLSSIHVLRHSFFHTPIIM